MARAKLAQSKTETKQKSKSPPIKKIEVAAIFDAYPAQVRTRLLKLRELIYTTAAKTPGVGPLEETLKWGQPSYVTPSKSGTTIRIDADLANPGAYALYVHCQTNLITDFRREHKGTFNFDGNRAIRFQAREKLPIKELQNCIRRALRYHIDKKEKAQGK